MGKLRALAPRLSSLPPRIGYAPGDEKAGDKARNVMSPWRAWYRTPRWQKLRQRILLRDIYTCRMCSRISAIGMVVDHIKPHKGNAELFWDEANLQTLCASPCHNKHKQKLENAERFG